MNGVITSDFIVRHTLILTGVFVLVETFAKYFSEWIKVLVINAIILVLIGVVRS